MFMLQVEASPNSDHKDSRMEKSFMLSKPSRLQKLLCKTESEGDRGGFFSHGSNHEPICYGGHDEFIQERQKADN